MSFTRQIGNPNATYPPSLTLAQSANGVGLVSIGSDVKYVTFNPIPSYSWIPLSANPYESYIFDWYNESGFEGDYYTVTSSQFSTISPLIVKTLDFYSTSESPRLSGLSNLQQYVALTTLQIGNYDGNSLEFLYPLLSDINWFYIYDIPHISNNAITELIISLSSLPQLTSFGVGICNVISIDLQHVPQLKKLYFYRNDYLINVDITGLSAVDLKFNDNNLPLSAVNHIAVQCDTSGVTNGFLYLNGGTNSPLSGVGITAADNLIAKGWLVASNE